MPIPDQSLTLARGWDVLIGLSHPCPLAEWGLSGSMVENQGSIGQRGRQAKEHNDTVLSFIEHLDVQDLSAVLTYIISLGPHNIPERGIAARKLKLRWGPP